MDMAKRKSEKSSIYLLSMTDRHIFSFHFILPKTTKSLYACDIRTIHYVIDSNFSVLIHHLRQLENYKNQQ